MYLSLGSNLGDRERNLRTAVEALRDTVRITAVSSLYETDPVAVVDQPLFLYRAVVGLTDLGPEALLDAVKRVERQVGREPTYHWGPRIVDVDIVLYGDLVIDSPRLAIPHPDMAKRAFVLVPLAEIAGEVVHPVLKVSVEELRDKAGGLDTVRRVAGA